jgi:predicted amidohydrolase
VPHLRARCSPVPADVAITGGRIAAITPRYQGAAHRVIDARGLVVASGFRTP